MSEGRWFRFYEQVVNDIKVQRLPDKLFKAWVNILCLASANGGYLPDEDEIAFSLRLTAAGTGGILDNLHEAGLIERTEDGRVRPHNWNGRQYKSDVSTERVKEFRKRRGNVSSAVSVTPPETDTDTEKEKKTSLREAKESDGAEAPPPPVENSNGHSKPSSRGTRLSEGWEPLEEHVALARGWGLSDDEIKWEHAKFTDYWMAKSGSRAAMVDWDRTWCNWMRRVADDKRNRVQRQKSYEEKGKPQQRPN